MMTYIFCSCIGQKDMLYTKVINIPQITTMQGAVPYSFGPLACFKLFLLGVVLIQQFKPNIKLVVSIR